MEENVIDLEESIIVRDPDGRFKPVQPPEGFTPLAFRNAVAAYDTAYRTLGKQPTVDEVHIIWPKIPKITYSMLFLTEEFRRALLYRGIEFNHETGLTIEQSMALLKLTDPTDRRMTNTKLKDLGIPMARYQAWMKQPLFIGSYKTQSEAGLKEAVPMVLTKLVGNAETGDQRAIEKVLEITGRWNPAAQQVDDARTVVLAIVESVIKHVQDAEIRKEIMADVALYAGTLGAIAAGNQLEG